MLEKIACAKSRFPRLNAPGPRCIIGRVLQVSEELHDTFIAELWKACGGICTVPRRENRIDPLWHGCPEVIDLLFGRS